MKSDHLTVQGSPTRLSLSLYIGNTPNLPDDWQRVPNHFKAGELKTLIDANSNHWTKVYNILAKILWRLDDRLEVTWQHYRAHMMLQEPNRHHVYYQQTKLLNNWQKNDIRLVSGKSYAMALLQQEYEHLTSINEDFLWHVELNVIVTPYFDYRQLTNAKMDKLIKVIESVAEYNADKA